MFLQKTYKSRAEIDGGSAINSNSAGGSLGTNGCSTDLRISCCFCCAAAVTDSFESAAGKFDGASLPKNKTTHKNR